MDINEVFATGKKKAAPPAPIAPPPTGVDVMALEALGNPLVNQANALTVVDQGSLDVAGRLLTECIKPLLKEIAESTGPVVAAAHAAHRAATKQRNDLNQPLLEAETTIKGKVSAYLDELERLRRIEEARIAEDLRQREAALARARREQEEREAEMLKQAEALEAAGKHEEAAEVIEAVIHEPIETAPILPPPVISPALTPSKTKGVSSSVKLVPEVVDMLAFVKGVAAGTIPITTLKVDQTKLNQLVRALDGDVNYPGVKINKHRSVSSRAL